MTGSHVQYRRHLVAFTLAAVLGTAACGGSDDTGGPSTDAADIAAAADPTTADAATTVASDGAESTESAETTGVVDTGSPDAGSGGGGLGASLFPGESDVCPVADDSVVLATMAADDEIEIVLKNNGGTTVGADVATRCDYLGRTLDTVRVSTLDSGAMDAAKVVEFLRSAEAEPVTVEGALDAVLFATDDVDAALPESDGSPEWNIASNQTGFEFPSLGLAAHDGERLVFVYHDVSAASAAEVAPTVAATAFTADR